MHLLERLREREGHRSDKAITPPRPSLSVTKKATRMGSFPCASARSWIRGQTGGDAVSTPIWDAVIAMPAPAVKS